MLEYYWPIGVICIILGWLGAVAYFFKTPPVYLSSAEILLSPKDPTLATRGVDGASNVNATVSRDLLATHIMLIKSPAIVNVALEKKGLSELPSLLSEMKETDTSTADVVIRNLSVSRGGKGDTEEAQVLKIAFEHNNSEDARLIVESIIEEFKEFTDKNYADVNQTAAELITKAQQQLKSDLEKVEREYKEFSLRAPILVGNENTNNVYRAEFEQIETELTDLRMERAQKISRLQLVEEQLKRARETGGSNFDKLALIGDESAERIKVFLEVLTNRQDSMLFMAQQPERMEVARGEYEELLKLKARLKSLIADFGPEHAEVRNVRGQIETVESFINSRIDKLKVEEIADELTADAILDAYVSLLKHDLRAYESREALLIENSKKAEGKAKELQQLELEGESLKLAVDRQKELFDATVERLHEINLVKDYGGFVNQTIAEPMNGVEVWPKLPKCAAMGTIAGLLVASVISVVLELQNRTIRNIADVEQITGIDTISIVPKLTEHLEPEYQRQIKESGSTISPTIVAFHQPGSRESEVFRGLRTTLLFKANAIGAKAIAVTSPTAGDGKSTVMLNIAMSLAHAGRRVLLIDADMRRPTLAKNLGIDGNLGLSNLLDGTASVSEVVQDSGKANLSVILSGPTPENPAELLATQQFKDLIEEAKSEYDIVLIDCPPVLAVADPCVVSSSVDTMLLVLRINSKSKVELKRAISLISAVNASLIGTVVNASKILTAEGYKMGDYSGYEYGVYGRKPNTKASSGASIVTKATGKSSNALNNGHTRSERS